jgi:hypothetical protein
VHLFLSIDKLLRKPIQVSNFSIYAVVEDDGAHPQIAFLEQRHHSFA